MAPGMFRAVLLAGLGSAACCSAGAYEADMHYGMTFWLARQAGLSQAEAHEMARGDQNADDGYLDAKHAIVLGVCLLHAKTASEMVRRHHFRSQNPVPRPPPQRPVDSDDAYAKDDVLARIGGSGTVWMDRLNEFGLALHGWQDSFSHQGESSHIPGCDDQWVWAHSAARGGVLNLFTAHNADLTFKYPDDCLAAAKSSHGYIEQLRQRHRPEARGKAWSALEDDVQAFCQLSTKAGKAQWLAGHGVPQADAIVRMTNLPDGERSFEEAPELDLDARGDGAASAADDTARAGRRGKPPSMDGEVERAVAEVYKGLGPDANGGEVQRWFDEFLHQWVTTSPYEMSSVVKTYFAFGPEAFSKPESVEDRLLRWRMRDRGLAADPKVAPKEMLKRSDSFAALAGRGQSAADRLGFLKVAAAVSRPWRQAFVPVRRRELPVLLAPAGNGKGLVAAVILRHAPYDIQLFTITPSGPAFRITRWASLAFH